MVHPGSASTSELAIGLPAEDAAGWRTLADHPDEPCAVLLYTPSAAHDGAVLGEDWRIEVAHFVRGGALGDAFLEQGTNHHIWERSEAWGGHGHVPTHWFLIPAPPAAPALDTAVPPSPGMKNEKTS